MESLNFDTTFLIDLQRETNRVPGPAHEFLQQNPAVIPCISLITLGEYSEGFSSPSDADCLQMVDSFELLPFTRQVAETYSRISRGLRKKRTSDWGQ